MARGVGRPPKQVLSRNSSQESDGENSGGSNGENSGINLLEPPSSSLSLLSAPPTPLKQNASSASSSHNSNYVAPQWLLEKKTAKFFSVPIPAVPSQVQDTLEQNLLDSGDLLLKRKARKSHKLLAQIKHWQDQLAISKQEVAEQKEMLHKAVSIKESKLAAMRKQKKAEIQQKLQKLEDKLKQKRDEKLKEAEEATRKKIVEEFEIAFEKEEESRKRKRIKEAEELAANQAAEGKQGGSESADATNNKHTTKDGGGEVQQEKKKKKLKSELIQEKIDAANAKTESLTEMKSEMVWLMKQVIKAEMKQKLMDPRKKEGT